MKVFPQWLLPAVVLLLVLPGSCRKESGSGHCSANAFFSKQLGKAAPSELMPAPQRYKYLPKGIHLPASYRMDTSGLLLREDILDIAQVEAIYVTPRNYIYQMNKIGDELSMKNQQEESSSSPLITLELIESLSSPRQIHTSGLNHCRMVSAEERSRSKEWQQRTCARSCVRMAG